jgi:hypothetical protein
MLHPHGVGSFRLEPCPPSTIAPLLNYSSPNPRRAVAPSIDGLRVRLRRFVSRWRSCAYPKPSAHGLRSGMSALTAPKSNVYTKPLITRCGSLNDRAPARVRNEAMGPPPSGKSQGVDPNPSFQTEPERATAPYDPAARRVKEQNLRTISRRKPRGTTAHSSRCCSCVR